MKRATFILLLTACAADKESDRDGDGYTDAEEAEAGTNPDYVYSHPYPNGNYNVGYCEEPPNPSGPSGEATYDNPETGVTHAWNHYQTGDVVDNVILKDQYGQNVALYSFCGRHVMLTLGTFS